jgi:rhodanese-related sulfurtransferase
MLRAALREFVKRNISQEELVMAEPINREELQTLVHNGAQVVEVLGAKEYEHAHIPQAINLPLAELDRESSTALLRDRMVIVYCYDSQ